MSGGPKHITAWTVRLRELGTALDAAEERRFSDELAEQNRRRLSWLLPVMLLLHAVHVGMFWTPEGSGMPDAIVQWRRGLVLVHAVTLAFAFVALCLTVAPGRIGRWLGTAVSVLYLLHGAAISGVDQLNTANVSAYMGYAFGIAVLPALAPTQAVAVYAIGLTAYVAAILTFQESEALRQSVLPNGPSSTLASLAMAFFLHSARRREFSQRVLVDRQRGELERLNRELEERVASQVSEIVARAAEVEKLNAQLKAQVRDRSAELSAALAKLAEHRNERILPQGTLLAARFELGPQIGQGGMGIVYQATDRVTQGQVAVKVIRAHSEEQLLELRRFLREAETVSSLSHPAIVRMLHVDFAEDGSLFQVQELVQGEVSSKLVDRLGRFGPSASARVVGVLAEALAAAHAAGFVHRDVKPANIMLTPAAPGLKLLDFGISRLRELGDADLTATGRAVGTPLFMAPEQMLGERELTDRADIYALGVTAFLLLTGHYPHDGTLAARLGSLSSPPPDPRATVDVPAPLASLVVRCLAFEPGARPSATEVAAALHGWADDKAVPSLERLVQARALAATRPKALVATER